MNYYPTREIISEQRFGFGPKLITGNEKWLSLTDQLETSSYIDPALAALPSTNETLVKLGEFNQKRQQLKKEPAQKREIQKQRNRFINQCYQQQVAARSIQTAKTPYGFQEQLIQFWSNHFAVSADTRKVQAIIGGIENDVIRQHWNGNFNTMLQAVIKHPTMLMFLDNNLSIGPDSKQGAKRNKGLNENLAREIMELHTLGVDGGYSQNDVINLANAITGWAVNFQGEKAGFKFYAWNHQPGTVTLLGKQYRQKGIAQGEACLQDLALHPETAKYLSAKLVQHFIGRKDPSLINQLSEIYLQGKGDLKPVYQHLINQKEVMLPTAVRFRMPQEWLFAMVRSANVELEPQKIHYMLRLLGQEPFMAGSPAGWSDQDSDYNSSSALVQRWQVANNVAVFALKQARKNKQKTADFINQVMDNLYGPDLDQHTKLVIDKADSAISKLVLLWLSPQFMYR